MGRCVRDGVGSGDRVIGSIRNDAGAFEHFLRAAELGHVPAMVEVATGYRRGRGVAADYAQALRWARAAADTGDAGGLNAMGMLCELGQGLPKDRAAAVRWFGAAGAKGDYVAQGNLRSLAAQGDAGAKAEMDRLGLLP